MTDTTDTPVPNTAAGRAPATRAATSRAHRRRAQQHQHGRAARPQRRAPRAHRDGLRRRHPRPRQPRHAARRVRRARPRRAAASTSWSRSCAPVRDSPRRPSSAPIGMLRAESQERPADVLSLNILSNRGRTIRPKTLNQKRYVDAIDKHTIVFGHRPGRHRQDLPGDGQGGAGAAGQAGQPDHPHPPRGRGGRAARLPARHAEREDRPLPAPAVRRAARHARPRDDPQAAGGRHHRGRAAGLHARPLAQRRLHHPRRGAEHLAGADEDVPHPPRLRLQDRRHRRHHPDRPARRRSRAACGSSRSILNGVEDLSFNRLTSHDVVRHRLVGRIVAAYDDFEAQSRRRRTGSGGRSRASCAVRGQRAHGARRP